MSETDLFVVCKSCGSEVSPYITECPYCGQRLRKRAPKLDRDGQPVEKRRRRTRVKKPKQKSSPRLGKLKPGELPGVRVDGRPYGTIALLVASVGLEAVMRADVISPLDVIVFEELGDEWWRIIAANFVYGSVGYQLVCFVTIALFGWLLERRLGPIPVVLAALACGAAGMAIAVALENDALALGGNAMALGLLTLWAVPDLLRRRAGEETESDLLGTAIFASVVLCMPLAVDFADGFAAGGGALTGAVLGLGLWRSGR